jgi:hypothetical protein
MKPKDLICIVGAPVKTAVEIPLIIATTTIVLAVLASVILIFGVLIRVWLHDHINFHFPDWAPILIPLAVIALAITAGFIQRTQHNYNACKTYWNS